MDLRIGRRVIQKDDESDRPRRLNLPKEPIVDEHAQFVPTRVKPGERTIPAIAEEFHHFIKQFAEACRLADEAARGACQAHAEMHETYNAHVEAVEAQRRELHRLRMTLPIVPGGEDEEDNSDHSNSAGSDTSLGEATVPNQPVARRS